MRQGIRTGRGGTLSHGNAPYGLPDDRSEEAFFDGDDAHHGT